jgi:hypothetical protein
MVSKVPAWKRVSMRTSALLLLPGFAVISYAQTYNGPKDPAINRAPKGVSCSGIPDYPKGANLDFPPDYVGNLQDGFTQSIPAGSDGAFIFMGMGAIFAGVIASRSSNSLKSSAGLPSRVSGTLQRPPRHRALTGLGGAQP